MNVLPLESTTSLSPPRIRVCATDSVGKTTFPNNANKPVVVPTADSFGKTTAAHSPSLTTMEK